jgi:hypothetical protein
MSFAAAALACAASLPAPLTIVLEFKGPHSDRSIAEMKHELEGIMKQTGRNVAFRERREVQEDSFDNLVVVRFNGTCMVRPAGYMFDERGPLAYTHTVGGEVLPFSEVECDKVVASVRSAMFGGDYAHADTLLGRALGRVLAHEIVHILSGSGDHGKAGVARESLSGAQLIGSELGIEPADRDRLH